MIPFPYLSKGLNALARAHRLGPMAGHLGAAVVAGYFVGEQKPDLEPEVNRGIEGDLKKIMEGGSLFGSKMSKAPTVRDSALFEPFPEEKADESQIDRIAEALTKNIGELRESGHNVIFASIAIHALKEHPEFATPAIIEGICKLIHLFDSSHPGSGYYGKEKGRIYGNKVTLSAEEEANTPAYTNLEGMVDAVFDALVRQDPKLHQQGYGGLIHVNNHAAAITDLAQYGYSDLVPAAISSHRRHLQLLQNLPNVADEFGPAPFSADSPFTAAYWTSGKVPYDRALLTHRVKTMFGFHEMAEAVGNDHKEILAGEKLRYLM